MELSVSWMYWLDPENFEMADNIGTLAQQPKQSVQRHRGCESVSMLDPGATLFG